VATLPFTIAIAWSLAILLHWWPRLSSAWRRRISVATSAIGVGFLVAAVRSEGVRESALRSVVLVGPATLTATASASASLYYYVLTAFCLLLGFAGLAFGEALSRRLSPRWLACSVAVAWLVTVVRFLLEKSAAPALLVDAMGVTWLAPVAGAYLATGLGSSSPGRGPLLRALVRYAFLVRGFVALVGVLATRLGLGTHYDVSSLSYVWVAATGRAYTLVPGSWWQLFWLTLLPQLVFWPAFTVLAGLLGGMIAGLGLGSGRGAARTPAVAAGTLPTRGRD
jgi:hypothetical protein